MENLSGNGGTYPKTNLLRYPARYANISLLIEFHPHVSVFIRNMHHISFVAYEVIRCEIRTYPVNPSIHFLSVHIHTYYTERIISF